MIKLFLSGHGQIASGMKKSIDILTGDSSNLTIFDAYTNDANLEDVLDAFYDQTDPNDIKILISDIVGGSVNQLMYPYSARPNTFLVSGINLALLLELVVASNRESITKEEILHFIKSAKDSIQLIEADETNETNNEFF